tara:strand:+ start:152 stop:298 length:147 start_codon:yes stop_codon:yes gene_type:complete
MTRLDDLSTTELRWYYRSLGGTDELFKHDELIAAIRHRRSYYATKESG